MACQRRGEKASATRTEKKTSRVSRREEQSELEEMNRLQLVNFVKSLSSVTAKYLMMNSRKQRYSLNSCCINPLVSTNYYYEHNHNIEVAELTIMNIITLLKQQRPSLSKTTIMNIITLLKKQNLLLLT